MTIYSGGGSWATDGATITMEVFIGGRVATEAERLALMSSDQGPMPASIRRYLAQSQVTPEPDLPRPAFFWSADGATWDDFVSPSARKERHKIVVAAKLTERRLHKRRANRARR